MRIKSDNKRIREGRGVGVIEPNPMMISVDRERFSL
jgi:hypothetical protein